MRRRKLLVSLTLCAAGCLAGAPSKEDSNSTIRGKLRQPKDKSPTLEVDGGEQVALDGDESTRLVLADERLAGADLEVNGHFANPGKFVVNPIHTKAMYVYHDGKRHYISYWCQVCSIRTYEPGLCVCCRDYTALDLQEAEKKQ